MGRRWFVLGLVLLAACGVQLDNTVGGATTDAGGGGGADADQTLTPDAPACFNGRVVYLNFTGADLMRGTSDATINRASWMQGDTGTAPAYRLGSATRAAEIQAITDGVRQQLSSFPVIVVDQRPAAGPYVMIVFGGTAQQVTSRFGGAVNQLDCGDNQKSDVAWISDGVQPTQRIVNFAIGAIGFGLGLTATTNPADCMCGWDNTCTSNNNAACQLTDNIARDPAANQLCPGLTTQSETAAFTQAFCQ